MAKLGKNITFPIYKGDGTSFHNLVLHKSTYDSVVMSLSDKITGEVYYKDNTLDVSMNEYINVKRNPDDAQEEPVKYVLVNPPTILREGLVSENGQLNGMTKYSFVFYHPMYKLGNLPFTDVAVSADQKRYLSESRNFSWIGTAIDYVDKMNKNLEGTEFVVRISENLYDQGEPSVKLTTLSNVLTFNDTMMDEALKVFYETYAIPYVVDQLPNTDSDYASGKRFLILVGLPYETIDDGQGNEFVFRFGQGVGLKNNSRTPRNNKIVTRVAGYGSEENIPYGYPQIRWYGPSDWTNTKNDPTDPTAYPIYEGIVGGELVKLIKHPFTRKNLMPTVYVETLFNKVSPYNSDGTTNTDYDPDTTLVDYYDATAEEDYPNPINPVAPSYESHEFADIKPQLGHETTITGATPLNDDLTPATDWDDSLDDNGEYKQSYFKISLPQLSFDLYACAAITQEMNIVMRSGACIGCTFPVQIDWDDYKKNFYRADGTFDPVPHTTEGDLHVRDITKYPDSSQDAIDVIAKKENSTFGTLMPNVYQKPLSGDEIVFTGISLPQSYIDLAQALLDDAMKQWMLENNVHYWDYPLKFDEQFLSNNTDILLQLRPNVAVTFVFADTELTLYVKQLTIKYGEKVLPQYDITLTDNIEASRNSIGQAQADITKIDSGLSRINSVVEDITRNERIKATGSSVLPVFFNGNNRPQPIDGLEVPESIRTQKNVEAMWGVSAFGIANMAISGTGGGGTVTAVSVNGTRYTPSNGLITLPDYPSLDGYATENYVASYFDANFTQLNIKNTLGISDWALASTKPSYNFSEIGAKPSTLGGYGISDAHITNGEITLGQNTITPATLTNGKIPLSQIPDAILGQMLYGGTVNGSGVVTLSQNAKDKWGITSLTLTSTNYADYEGAFFIASANGSSGVPSSLGVLVGDWIIATSAGWGKIDNTDAVTGVKGNAESSYRIGNVNITPANIGLGNVENTALSTWVGTNNITTLGTITTGVWNGTAIADTYIASAATWNAKQNALAFDGTYDASTNKVATKSTVTNAINALDVSNISGFGAGKTLASLTETDGKIAATFQDISITKSQVSDFPTTWALADVTGADDLKAIEALTGTSGFLKKTAANTWALDTDVASETALSGVSTRVGTLEGYFNNGKLNSANIDLATGDDNGQVKIAGTNVSVKGWNTAATHAHGDYVTAVGIDATNGKLKWYLGGVAQTAPNIVAARLVDTNKTMFGNTYWTSSGIPASIGTATAPAALDYVTNIDGLLYFDKTNRKVEVGTSASPADIQSFGGVSAMGIANMAINGGGGQGTLTQIKVNGTAIADVNGVVNITATTGNANGKIAIAGQQIPVYGLGTLAYASSLSFDNLSSHPTTLGGYGITDAKIANGVITLGGNTITPLTSHQTLYNLVINNSAGTAQITYKPAVSGTYALTLTKAMVGLGNVENTALSTWTGSTNITTLGTITTGTWNGTAIADNYIASAATWNAKQDAISDLSTIRSRADEGHTAYGWGNHADAGYFAASSFTKANIKSTLEISDWALAASKPSYAFSEIAGTASDSQIPTLAISKISGLQTALDGKLATSLKGAANGLAELDANGLVPSSQLPSYVDDVLEYASKSAFPATGTAGKIYVALDTNLTYRWSGSAYTEISPSLALGETSSTAYRGDRGKTAYDHATDASRLTTAKSSGFYKFATTAEGHIASVTAVAASDLTSLIGSTTYAPYNANGYLPLSGGTMANTNVVTNLNADLLDGNNLMEKVADWDSSVSSIFKSSENRATNAPTGDFVYGIHLRFHRSANMYFTDFVTSLYADNLWFRRHTENGYGSWFTILHSGNSSVSKSGETLTVKINGTSQSLTNTNTHRPIQLNGTEILGNNTTALNLKAGTGVSLTNSSGTVTFDNSGVRAATINGDYLRINTNGTNADLTIPYASRSTDTKTELLTEQEFIYRQTAGGGLTYKPSAAVIKRILGNSVVWNQRANLGALAGNNTTRTLNDTGFTSTAVAGSAEKNCVIRGAFVNNGHSYYLSFDYKSNLAYNVRDMNSARNMAVASNWTHNSKIGVCTSSSYTPLYWYLYSTTTEAWNLEVKNITIIDLTLFFNGNIPANLTPEQFEEKYNIHGFYEPNAGQLINNSAKGLESTGFNLWDEVMQMGTIPLAGDGSISTSSTDMVSSNFIPVIGGSTYYFKMGSSFTSSLIYYYYDENKNYFQYSFGAAKNSTFIPPANARYMRFVLYQASTSYGTNYKRDICLNRSDSTRNGQYEPHKKNVLPLFPLKCKAPNGDIVIITDAKSAGSVRDERVGNKFIQRVGDVDLGALGWMKISGSSSSYDYFASTSGQVPNTKEGGVIRSVLYVNGGVGGSSGGNMECYITGDARIRIRNLSYSDAVTFTTAMSGELLYYELATPIEYEIIDEAPYEYPIDVLGTERIISDEMVAPFIADIQYGAEQRDIAVDINKLHISAGLLSNRASALESYFTDGIAKNAARLSNTSAIGSTTKPVYFTANGVPSACSDYAGGTAVTLNGSSKAASTASFYAPTGAGTSGQILKSTAGTPEWINQSAITAGALTTVSKTAWGQTFWTSGGIPASISGNMTNVGDITPSADKQKNLGSESLQFSYVYASRLITNSGNGLRYCSTTGKHAWYNSYTTDDTTKQMELTNSALTIYKDVQGMGGVSAMGIANMAINSMSGVSFASQIAMNGQTYNATSGLITLPNFTDAYNPSGTGSTTQALSQKGAKALYNAVIGNIPTSASVAGWGYKKGMVYTTATASDSNIQVATGADPTYQYVTNTSQSTLILVVTTSNAAANSYGVHRYVMIYNDRSSATLVKFADQGQGVVGPADNVSIPANSYMEFRIIHPASNAKCMVTWSAPLKDIDTM